MGVASKVVGTQEAARAVKVAKVGNRIHGIQDKVLSRTRGMRAVSRARITHGTVVTKVKPQKATGMRAATLRRSSMVSRAAEVGTDFVEDFCWKVTRLRTSQRRMSVC